MYFCQNCPQIAAAIRQRKLDSMTCSTRVRFNSPGNIDFSVVQKGDHNHVGRKHEHRNDVIDDDVTPARELRPPPEGLSHHAQYPQRTQTANQVASEDSVRQVKVVDLKPMPQRHAMMTHTSIALSGQAEGILFTTFLQKLTFLGLYPRTRYPNQPIPKPKPGSTRPSTGDG